MNYNLLFKPSWVHWLFLAFFQLSVFLFIVTSVRNSLPGKDSIRYKESSRKTWEKAPKLTLFLRMYNDSVKEYWQVFAPSYLIFWPYRKWKNSDLVLVFDDESVNDHQTSTHLSILPPYPTIKFEKRPPDGTLCSLSKGWPSGWRREGYSRQIYSSFYADRYSESPFIGIADADSFFAAKVVVEDLFENGKPRIIGYNACCTGWETSASTIVDHQKIGEFMTVAGFPFIVRREHFKLFRDHVAKVYGSTFEKAFHRICAFPQYSQYNFLAYYLFFHHRDDYSWHIREGSDAVFPLLSKGRMTEDPEVLRVSQPKIGVMKHAGHENHTAMPYVLFDYICVAAASRQFEACNSQPKRYLGVIRKSVEANLVSGNLMPTAFWEERRLPFNMSMMIPWTDNNIPVDFDELFHQRDLVLVSIVV